MSGANQTCIMVYSETIYQTTCEYTDPSEGGGGYGGSGGGESNQSNNNDRITKEVAVDPEARDCLKKAKKILDSLGLTSTDTSINLIAKVLNRLNLKGSLNFNAIIKEGQVSTPNTFAETYAPNLNGNLWGTQGLVSEIRFNSSSLNKATDLAAVTAMMHEYIHAYFLWNMHLMERSGTYDSDFKSTYTLLFDKSGQIVYAPEKDAQHEQIAFSFTKQIASLLKSYAATAHIPTPADPKYFEKMSWAGLMGTSLAKFAPEGTNTTLIAEQGNANYKITQSSKCNTERPKVD